MHENVLILCRLIFFRVMNKLIHCMEKNVHRNKNSFHSEVRKSYGIFENLC